MSECDVKPPQRSNLNTDINPAPRDRGGVSSLSLSLSLQLFFRGFVCLFVVVENKFANGGGGASKKLSLVGVSGFSSRTGNGVTVLRGRFKKYLL